MPYTIDWYIENEIVYLHYSGATNPDELRTSLLELKGLIESSPRPLVHSITDVGDVTEAVSIPDVLAILRDVGHHERTGWQITIRENSPLLKMGLAFGTTIFKMRTRAFDNMDEAIEFLKMMDEAIHWEDINPSLE